MNNSDDHDHIQPETPAPGYSQSGAGAAPDQRTPGSGGGWLQRLRWRGRDSLGGVGIKSQRYLTKWLVLGALIGVVAGLGAVLFYSSIPVGHRFLSRNACGLHTTITGGRGGYGRNHHGAPLAVATDYRRGRADRGSDSVQPRARSRRTRHQLGHRCSAPQGSAIAGAGSTYKADSVGHHYRIGRVGGPRGTCRPDLGWLRVAAEPVAAAR